MDSNNNSANMKLAPGMLCLVIGAEINTDNIGKVVTLIRTIDKGEVIPELYCRAGRDFWLIKGEALTYSTKRSTGKRNFFKGHLAFALEYNLMPIRPEEDPLEITDVIIKKEKA